MIAEMIRDIERANVERNFTTVPRRLMKIGEELGEVAEAFLGVTSLSNPKGKTLHDLREEVADVMIVAIDTALTPVPFKTFADAPADIDRVEARLLGTAFEAGGKVRTPAEFMEDYFRFLGALSYVSLLVLAVPSEPEPGSDADFHLYQVQTGLYDIAEQASLLAMRAAKAVDGDEFMTALAAEVERKLAKWTANNQRASTQDQAV